MVMKQQLDNVIILDGLINKLVKSVWVKSLGTQTLTHRQKLFMNMTRFLFCARCRSFVFGCVYTFWDGCSIYIEWNMCFFDPQIHTRSQCGYIQQRGIPSIHQFDANDLMYVPLHILYIYICIYICIYNIYIYLHYIYIIYTYIYIIYTYIYM